MSRGKCQALSISYIYLVYAVYAIVSPKQIETYFHDGIDDVFSHSFQMSSVSHFFGVYVYIDLNQCY
jgi:hypothetical protein